MPSELATPTRAFVLGLADENGRLEAEPLYLAATGAGFSETKIRLTLRRLVDAGVLQQDGRGRKAVLQLTESGLATRSPDLVWVACAYRADAGLDPWDGAWHLAGFEIPETQRSARDALRDAIISLLGSPLSNGLYVTWWPWEPWLQRTADDHGVGDRLVTATTATLRVGERTAPAELAGALWPVHDLARGYDAFVARWSGPVDDPPADLPTATRMAFEASGEIEAVMADDPFLPAETLPADFAGPEARALYRRLLDALADAHPFIAEANLFGAYGQAIDRALTQSAAAFWRDALSSSR
ncbi:MAG: PaaX family transcriptional regulator C-terminal domain-containing protein [Actinomycetota bacterium]